MLSTVFVVVTIDADVTYSCSTVDDVRIDPAHSRAASHLLRTNSRTCKSTHRRISECHVNVLTNAVDNVDGDGDVDGRRFFQLLLGALESAFNVAADESLRRTPADVFGGLMCYKTTVRADSCARDARSLSLLPLAACVQLGPPMLAVQGLRFALTACRDVSASKRRCRRR